jgi:hypothetical protein
MKKTKKTFKNTINIGGKRFTGVCFSGRRLLGIQYNDDILMFFYLKQELQIWQNFAFTSMHSFLSNCLTPGHNSAGMSSMSYPGSKLVREKVQGANTIALQN